MPHGITDEGNPFEDLLDDAQNNDTDVELPDPVPTLPPLPQDEQQQQHQQQEQQHEQQEEQQPEQQELKQEQEQGEDSPPAAPTRKLTKSTKSTLQFKTDLTKSARDVHPCGVLHFARISGVAEEHAFAWIAHHENSIHLNATLDHMQKFGFDPDDATFLPYSSRRAWIDRYPLAFPHVHCGEDGGVSGFPYWSPNGGGGGGGNSVDRMMGTTDGGVSLGPAVAGSSTPSQRGRKKKKIFPTAHLPNDERDELHVEMYRYLRWLSTNVGTSAPAGIDVASLPALLETMESTFRAVRAAGPAVAARAATGIHNEITGSTLPLLEEALGAPLGRLAAASRANPEPRGPRAKRSKGLDFEAMYERLVRFHQANGHVNVPQKYAQDGQLGSWVANMRSKRKTMAKKGEEYEPEAALDDAEDEEDDAVEVEGEGGGGRKRKRSAGGRQRLTKERVHRLDTVGFQWVVANPNTKSWEERFEDLKEYQQHHGTTRVPRSSGTLGEWVHMQRRLYNKKDKNFLARRAPLLDDIGFEWHPRKHALVSWEDNFNRLVEFGRLNRHYNVQSPFPEGYVGDFDEQDGEVVEAHRFSKWVKRIHAEYRAYASGKGSRMLNDARVMQLREIGFQFLAT